MPKRKLLQDQKAASRDRTTNLERLNVQLKNHLQQKNYRQALDKVKQIQKNYPQAEIKPSESEIWLLRGQQEYGQGQYRQAEGSFRQALNLDLQGEAHYWLAKNFLALKELDAALDLIRDAFESKVLPKDAAGCYLKLLFLKGNIDEVSALLSSQSRRFSAVQLHWAKGVLSLEAGNPVAAIAHFQKMTRNATPGDSPQVWIAYAQQRAGNWSQSEKHLGMFTLPGFRGTGALPTFGFGNVGMNPALVRHPAIRRLYTVQAIAQNMMLPEGIFRIFEQDGEQTLPLVWQFLHALEESNYLDAAQALQRLDHPCLDFPEVDALFRPVMILGAEQAMQQHEVDAVTDLLEEIVYHPPFDVQLVLRLHRIYRESDFYPIQVVQRLLNYLLDNVKKEAKEHPQDWSESRLNPTLCQIQCWLADAWVVRGQHPQGYRALEAAERLCPDSPELIGRQGLKAYVQGKFEQAIPLMIKALEAGCAFKEVYDRLLSELKRQGDLDAVKDIRRRFGSRFGDRNVETEVELPPWKEALSTQDFEVFQELVQGKGGKDAALKACQIFLEAAQGAPSSSGRVGLNIDLATKQWDRLLQDLSASPEQISVIQSIFLSIQLFVKRQKGMAALQNAYWQRLLALVSEYPEAQVAYLVLWVVKGERTEQMQVAIRNYLHSSPQPATALAQIQLQSRWFVQTLVLQPLIDEFLGRESQHPQLLLAKATTYPPENENYEQIKEQGFELARRLQDAQALQAYREEDAFRAGRLATEVWPDLAQFLESGDLDMMKIIRKMFGSEVPPEILESMLPDLMQMLMNEMPNFEDEADFKPEFLFGRPPSFSKRKSSKSRRDKY
jgi:tetratricopeptide (TPR) repeat protein